MSTYAHLDSTPVQFPLLALHLKGQCSDNAFRPLGVLYKYKEVVNLYVWICMQTYAYVNEMSVVWIPSRVQVIAVFPVGNGAPYSLVLKPDIFSTQE